MFRAGPGVGTVTRPGLPLPAGRARHQPGAAADDPRRPRGGGGRRRRTARRRGRDLDPGRGGDRAEDPERRGSASSAGSRSSAPPGSWCPIRAPPGSTPSTAASTSPARRASPMSPARPASTSEAAVQRLHGLPEHALIDMGDFAGGMLKYLRRHPVPRVTVGRRLRQDDEARPGAAGPALARRRGRSRLAGRAHARKRAASPTRRGGRGANTAPRCWRDGRGARPCRSPTSSPRSAWRTAAAALARRGHRAGDRGVRPRGPAGRSCAVPSGA